MNVTDALLGITGSVSVALLLAVLFGQLVPTHRLERAQREAETWKKAYETLKEAHEAQVRITERSIQSAEIADKVMQALRDKWHEGGK